MNSTRQQPSSSLQIVKLAGLLGMAVAASSCVTTDQAASFGAALGSAYAEHQRLQSHHLANNGAYPAGDPVGGPAFSSGVVGGHGQPESGYGMSPFPQADAVPGESHFSISMPKPVPLPVQPVNQVPTYLPPGIETGVLPLPGPLPTLPPNLGLPSPPVVKPPKIPVRIPKPPVKITKPKMPSVPNFGW